MESVNWIPFVWPFYISLLSQYCIRERSISARTPTPQEVCKQSFCHPLCLPPGLFHCRQMAGSFRRHSSQLHVCHLPWCKNTGTMAEFDLPMWLHGTQRWEERHTMGFHKSVRSHLTQLTASLCKNPPREADIFGTWPTALHSWSSCLVIAALRCGSHEGKANLLFHIQ
jgi:hypothetical protein